MTAYLGNLSDDMRRHRRACVSVQPHQCQGKAEFLVLRFINFIYLIGFNSHEIVFKSSSFIVRSFLFFNLSYCCILKD